MAGLSTLSYTLHHTTNRTANPSTMHSPRSPTKTALEEGAAPFNTPPHATKPLCAQPGARRLLDRSRKCSDAAGACCFSMRRRPRRPPCCRRLLTHASAASGAGPGTLLSSPTPSALAVSALLSDSCPLRQGPDARVLAPPPYGAVLRRPARPPTLSDAARPAPARPGLAPAPGAAGLRQCNWLHTSFGLSILRPPSVS